MAKKKGGWKNFPTGDGESIPVAYSVSAGGKKKYRKSDIDKVNVRRRTKDPKTKIFGARGKLTDRSKISGAGSC